LTDTAQQMTPQAFTTSAFAGSLILAVWVFVRFPRQRPSTLKVAVAHVIASFVVFQLTPGLIDVCGTVPSAYVAVTLAVSLVVLPSLCYVYVSWLWLFTVIAKHLFGKPRGGKLVRAGA
jgi:hypothetical protein